MEEVKSDKPEEKKRDSKKEIFDRQERIEFWDQKKVENAICLVLGVGGLGCNVAMGLCRLGVKKLYLIDNDKVDPSNLSRQNLFSLQDIGKRKTEAAKDCLNQLHNVANTEIHTFDFCALKNWPKIVELAKDCTVVFNMIDASEYFDLAVQSLCLKLQIPMISGGNNSFNSFLRHVFTSDHS